MRPRQDPAKSNSPIYINLCQRSLLESQLDDESYDAVVLAQPLILYAELVIAFVRPKNRLFAISNTKAESTLDKRLKEI